MDARVRGEGSSYFGCLSQAKGKAYNNIYFRKRVQAGSLGVVHPNNHNFGQRGNGSSGVYPKSLGLSP